MGKDVIIACDFASKKAVLDFLDKFENEKPFVKIGMELFYAEGPAIVKEIKDRGHKIFLDLKLHDIPNTVKKAMSVLANLGVDMTNVHAGGTVAMMEAAIEGLTKEDGTRPLLIAVTQLTSTNQERMTADLLIEKPIDEVVMHYAANAKKAGLDGTVTEHLIFLICECLRGSNYDGVTSVDANGVEIFHATNSNSCIVSITHNLELDLLITLDALFYKNLANG